MTARTPAPKRLTARGRLLTTLDGLAFIAPRDAYKRRARIIRALRAYERDLAERASLASHRLYADRVRAAILGPQHAKGARR